MEWTLTDAKAHFSEVFNLALKGDEQVITRRSPGGGRERVVISAAKEARPETDMWQEIERLRKTMPLRATVEELIAWKNEGRK